MLCDIQTDFTGFGVSSMNEDEHILTGRPFVGIAILWRKSFTKHCSYDSDRIIGIELVCNSFTALFLCLYLPYYCSNNLDDYMFYLSTLLQIIDDYPSPYIFVCEDFNANIADRSQCGTAFIAIMF